MEIRHGWMCMCICSLWVSRLISMQQDECCRSSWVGESFRARSVFFWREETVSWIRVPLRMSRKTQSLITPREKKIRQERPLCGSKKIRFWSRSGQYIISMLWWHGFSGIKKCDSVFYDVCWWMRETFICQNFDKQKKRRGDQLSWWSKTRLGTWSFSSVRYSDWGWMYLGTPAPIAAHIESCLALDLATVKTRSSTLITHKSSVRQVVSTMSLLNWFMKPGFFFRTSSPSPVGRVGRNERQVIEDMKESGINLISKQTVDIRIRLRILSETKNVHWMRIIEKARIFWYLYWEIHSNEILLEMNLRLRNLCSMGESEMNSWIPCFLHQK